VRAVPFLLAAAFALAATLSSPAADACAVAPPQGEIVRVTDEAALIVWDPKTKTEHFIRTASFAATSTSFGFLVPTPTKPELSEVSGDLIPELIRHTLPRQKSRLESADAEVTCTATMFFATRGAVGSASAPAGAPVRVLDEKRVAGYNAVVLEADSANTLSEWLQKHGYAEGPTLTEWLKPYVAQEWKLTAFKIASDAAAKAISTSAVRMTFTTERPFYPYREPADQRETVPPNLAGAYAGRTLRVFFVGPGRFDGAIGDAGKPWPGRPRWSNPYEGTALPEQPLPFALPENAWLTDFVDESSPRPGTDEVYFAPAKDPSRITPPPIPHPYPLTIPIPLELVALAGFGGFWLFRRSRRQKAAAQASAPPAR
jgi:hypothetical protein